MGDEEENTVDLSYYYDPSSGSLTSTGDDGSDAKFYRTNDPELMATDDPIYGGTDTANEGSDAKFYKVNDPSLMGDVSTAGISSGLWDTLSKAGGLVASAGGTFTSFLKSNPALASLLLGGVANAEKQKFDLEALEKKQKFELDALDKKFAQQTSMAGVENQYAQLRAQQQEQYKIDAENRARAYAKELYDRKNDSITGMKPISGIIGGAMLQPTLSYLQGVKK